MPSTPCTLSWESARVLKFTREAAGGEGDLRVTRVFQNVLVHAAIACVASTRAAGCVHHQLPADGAGGGVDTWSLDRHSPFFISWQPDASGVARVATGGDQELALNDALVEV